MGHIFMVMDILTVDCQRGFPQLLLGCSTAYSAWSEEDRALCTIAVQFTYLFLLKSFAYLCNKSFCIFIFVQLH